MPAGCDIKGHYAMRAWPYRGIYHLPGCGSYRRTKAKRWFCSEEEALAARFRKAYTCGWWAEIAPMVNIDVINDERRSRQQGLGHG